MSIVTYLLGEHGVLYGLLDRVEELAPQAGLAEVRAYRDLVAEALRSHAQVEDELVFEPLERTGARAESAVRGMRTMHDDLDGALDELVRTGDVHRARQQLLCGGCASASPRSFRNMSRKGLTLGEGPGSPNIAPAILGVA